MAYQLQTEQIQPGGLNLVAPGDGGKAGDSLNLTGFWPGAAGRLEQAPGLAILSAAHLSNFDSIAQTSGRTYYGGGGDLHQVGRGGAGETPIDSGYDGYPLGLLGYQGYLWVMNRGQQRKDDGTTVTDWTPAPPGLPALTNPATTSASFTIHGTFGAQPDNPDSNGIFSQIKMWTSDPLTGVEIGALVVISGNPSAGLNGTWQVTNLFEGTPNLVYLAATVPAGTTFGLGGNWTFANPGPETGQYSYWVTWQYTDLGESNPSTTAGVITPATVTVTVRGTKVTVDISALTPPTGAAGWNVYRQSPGMASPYKVSSAMIPIATTTFDDFQDVAHSQDDDYLVSTLGVIMEGDHNAAPAARIMANQTYNGRIVVANSAAYPNRVWYTPALQPGFFRGSANPQAGDWVDIGTDRGDEILFLAVKPGQITVYRQKTIWRILSDFKDPAGRIDVMVPDLGIVGPRAVASTSLGDYFRSREGVYKYNGDWAQKVSFNLDPVFLGKDAEHFLAESPAEISNSALGFHAGRLWASYTSGGGAANNQSFVLHVDSDRWFARSVGMGAFLDAGTALLGAGANFAFTLETGYVDGVGTMVLGYQSEYNDCRLPDRHKTFADLVLSHNTQGATLTVAVRTDKLASETIITTIQSFSLTRQVIPLVVPGTFPAGHPEFGTPITGYSVAVGISGAGATGTLPIIIDGPLILHYYAEARTGMLFDSFPTNHGTPDTKTVDQVEIDVDASAGVAFLQVASDLPGGTMVARTTKTIARSNGRESRRIVLDAPADGKLLRYKVSTTTGVQVYGIRARVLPIGVYLDGTVSDFWAPQPISIGV